MPKQSSGNQICSIDQKEYRTRQYMEGTRTRALRKSYSIPEDLVEYFEKESRVRDTTPSALVSYILKKAASFDLPLSRIGFVTIPAQCFKILIERMDRQDLEEVAVEQATRNFGVLLFLLDSSLDFFSVLEKYYEPFGKYSGWYSFKHRMDPESYRLMFQHTSGSNWSEFLLKYNQTILERLCESITCRIEGNIVIFNVIPKRRSSHGNTA